LRADNTSWTLTGVYGPQEDHDKLGFLEEIKGLRHIVKVEWLVIGDFNLIYKAEDKSNDKLNRHMMSNFRQTIDEAQLMEIDLRARKFTWNNEQYKPTITRIDRIFGTPEWYLMFQTFICSHYQQGDPIIALYFLLVILLNRTTRDSNLSPFGLTCLGLKR